MTKPINRALGDVFFVSIMRPYSIEHMSSFKDRQLQKNNRYLYKQCSQSQDSLETIVLNISQEPKTDLLLFSNFLADSDSHCHVFLCVLQHWFLF